MGLFPTTAILAIFVLFTAVGSSPYLKDNADNKGISKSFADEYVPVRAIPGTDLFTGIYYEIGIKRFHKGWVTWTEKTNKEGGWNYVQIDARSENHAKYEKSGVWYNDVQWFFVPSESEEGWYNLRNRQVPESLVTWSKSDTADDPDSSYHVILDRNANPESPDSLWKPIQQPQPEAGATSASKYFQLRTKSRPEAIVTWTWKEYSGKDSHYIQVDTRSDPSHADNYKPNNDWYVDTLFRFNTLDKELIGEITQLEMQLFPKLEEIRSLTHTDCESVLSTIFINIDSNPLVRQMKQEFVNRGELTLKLHEPLSQIPQMKIRSSNGQISPPWYADAVEFQTVKHEYFSSDDIKLKTFEHGSINTNVIIPAWSTTEIRICREYIDTSRVDIEIDVFVFIEVFEMSYRPLNSRGKFEAVYTKLPAVENSLVNVTNSFDIDERWGLASDLASNNQKLGLEKEDSGIQILGSRESDIGIMTRGSVKGIFGFRGVVASN